MVIPQPGQGASAAVRLNRTIEAALTMQQQQAGERKWGMKFVATTGLPFDGSLSEGRDSGSDKGHQPAQQQQQQQQQQNKHLLV